MKREERERNQDRHIWEGWLSGRKHLTANEAIGNDSGVRIPHLPRSESRVIFDIVTFQHRLELLTAGNGINNDSSDDVGRNPGATEYVKRKGVARTKAVR